jgi:hypothetical protein
MRFGVVVLAHDVYINAPHDFWPAGWEGPPRARRLQVSSSEKEALLDKHNELRAGVTSPCTAADMQRLEWDDTLAAESQAYADQCVWAHDTSRNQQNGWGENLAMTTATSYTTDTLVNFVQMWYNEEVDAEWTDSGLVPRVYGSLSECQSPNDVECQIGHYTQVVWASTTKVGCGVATCSSGLLGSGGTYLVCKYTPAGNMAGEGGIMPPFLLGQSCATCADQCTDGLCDVGVEPNRCVDQSSFSMTVNDVAYSDCAGLTTMSGVPDNWWCDQQEATYSFCPLTCGTCSVPDGLGDSFCGTAEVTSTPTAEPTVQTVTGAVPNPTTASETTAEPTTASETTAEPGSEEAENEDSNSYGVLSCSLSVIFLFSFSLF